MLDLPAVLGFTRAANVLNPPKLVGLITSINAEDPSQRRHCLFPWPAVGCIHPVLSSKERLILTLPNPWTNILPHHQRWTHSHTTVFHNTLHPQTSAALLLDIRLLSLSLHGEMWSTDKCFHCSHVHWPWTIATLPCGLSLLSHFIVFLLPFVHVSFCPPSCFVALCPSCFFLWMTTVKAGKNDLDICYLPFITWFVDYP